MKFLLIALLVCAVYADEPGSMIKDTNQDDNNFNNNNNNMGTLNIENIKDIFKKLPFNINIQDLLNNMQNGGDMGNINIQDIFKNMQNGGGDKVNFNFQDMFKNIPGMENIKLPNLNDMFGKLNLPGIGKRDTDDEPGSMIKDSNQDMNNNNNNMGNFNFQNLQDMFKNIPGMGNLQEMFKNMQNGGNMGNFNIQDMLNNMQNGGNMGNFNFDDMFKNMQNGGNMGNFNFQDMFKNIPGMQNINLPNINDIFGKLNLPGIGKRGLVDYTQKLKEVLANFKETAGAKAKEYIEKFLTKLKEVAPNLFENVSIGKRDNGVKDALTEMANQFMGHLKDILASLASQGLDKIISAIKPSEKRAVLDNLKDLFNSASSKLKEHANNFADKAKDLLQTLAGVAKDHGKDVAEKLKPHVEDLKDQLVQHGLEAINKVLQSLANASQQIAG